MEDFSDACGGQELLGRWNLGLGGDGELSYVLALQMAAMPATFDIGTCAFLVAVC